MFKFIKKILLIISILLLIWIDLPENFKIKNYTINPLSLNFNLFGLQIKKEFKTHLGLDLKGGSHLVFQADTSKVEKTDLQDALNSARDIIEKRVNFFGVSEPTVQTLKSGNTYRISVDLPGIENVNEAVALIGKTAQLSFFEQNPQEKVASGSPIYATLTKNTGLTGKHIKKSEVVFDQQTGKPEVSLSFNKEGGDLFAKITARNIGKPVAIVIDNMIISAPTVQQQISEGNAVITGNFTVDEAKKLAIAINSGALPLPIKLVEQKNIGPTLGAVEVKKSVIAGFFGLAMVLFFMILYYGKLGIVASMALVI